MFPLPANIYAEIAAFLTSVIFFKKLWDTRLRWLPFFLFFILFTELSGRYMYKELHASNSWLYNISIPIEYLFYCFLFNSFYKTEFNKRAAKIFLVVFPIWVLLSLFFINGFYIFNTSFLKIGSISTLFFCLLFFIELLKAEEFINPFRQPMFWLACGLFLFNAGEFAYNTFSDIMMKEWRYGKNLFQQINNNLIFVLYTSIIIEIISFSWAPKEKT